MTTRFYLHNAVNAQSGTFPSSKQGSSTPTYSLANAATLRAMDTTIGTSQVSETGTTSATTSEQFGACGWWVSQPLAAGQNLNVSITWTLNGAIAESNTNQNLGDYRITLYIWSPGSGTLQTFIGGIGGYASTGGAEPTATSSEQVSVSSATGTGPTYTTSAGDVLILELSLDHTQGMATAYTSTFYYDGTTVTTVNNTVVSNHAAYLESTFNFSFGSQAYSLTLSPGSYSVTGAAATLGDGYNFNAAAGSYAVTGSAATLIYGHTLTLDPGSYSVTGSAITTPVTLSLNAAAGAYNVTGAVATVGISYGLTLASGAYTLTGSPASMPLAYQPTISPGSYSVTGSAGSLLIGRTLTLASGSYALTGAAATTAAGYTPAISPGSYSVTGSAATITQAGGTVAYALTLDPGAYSVIGADSMLSYATLTPAQPFQGGGPGLAPDRDYWHQVNNYWQAIEAAREKQRQKEAEQQQVEAAAEQERQRIHARMAELRAIKRQKKADREELAALQAEEDKIRAQMAQASAEVIAMIDTVNGIIAAMEAYKRRYQASLIMLLLGVN